jgi:hypothetical protein
MHRSHLLPFIAVALVSLLGTGCSDDSRSEVGADLKKTGQDVAQKTKAAGEKVADELSDATSGLVSFAKEVGNDVSDSAQVVGQKIEAKMPDLEALVTKTKAKLAAGGAQAKEAATHLDDKLATLKTKLADLTKAGANATKEAKDDVVSAFKDLVDSIQSGLSKLAN